MALTDDYNLIYKIARLYFIENMSQLNIAKAMGVSRASVCRALDTARESGMVNISLSAPPPKDSHPKLAGELKELLGLNDVVLAATAHSDDTPAELELLSQDVSMVAGMHMPQMLKNARMIGLGWGRTIYNTATHLPSVNDGKRRVFVPLVNNFTTSNAYLQTTCITARFADSFRALGYYLNVTNRERQPGERTVEESDQLRQLSVYWDALDAAVITFSSTENLKSYEYCGDLWYSEGDEGPNRHPGALFEVLAHVYYADGSYFRFNPNYDLIAMDLQRLRQLPTVVCVAAGKKKVDAIINAAHCGFYKTLVVDIPTAEAVVQKLTGH